MTLKNKILVNSSEANSFDLISSKLIQARRKQKVSFQEIYYNTRIRTKYIKIFENPTLLAKEKKTFYLRSYLSIYTRYLGLDPRPFMDIYDSQDLPDSQQKYKFSFNKLKNFRAAIGPKTFVSLIAITISLSILFYIFLQISNIISAPKLFLDQASKIDIKGSLITVSGQSDATADTYINNNLVLTDSNGRFKQQITLNNGVNTITVLVRNKVGRVSSKQLVVNATMEDSKTKSDITSVGLQLDIRALEKDLSIKVKTDNDEDKTYLLVAGSRKIFRATSKIELATSNAKNTKILITNNKYKDKDIGILSNTDAAKRFVFNQNSIFE
jgi:cytoskeletal protein RodZ